MLREYITYFGECFITLDVEGEAIPVLRQPVGGRVEADFPACPVVTEELDTKLKDKSFSIFIFPTAAPTST